MTRLMIAERFLAMARLNKVMMTMAKIWMVTMIINQMTSKRRSRKWMQKIRKI